MKAIILSAGKGERLLPLTKDRPKIIIELGDGTTMLSRQYNSFFNNKKIDEIVIGSGYCAGKVDEYIDIIRNSLKISSVYNPFYAISGPLVTLWVALNKINDSNFIFLNGDTIYGQAVHNNINKLADCNEEGVYLFCSYTHEFSPDDVKVLINDDLVIEAGKNIDNGNAISAGLVMVKGESISSRFRSALDAVSRREDFLKYNKTWHSFINDLVEFDIRVQPVIVNTSDWIEVDLHFELEELQKILAGKLHLDVR